MNKNVIKKLYSEVEIQLKEEKVELGLLQDLKQKIQVLKEADKLSSDVFTMYDKAVTEAKSFSDRYSKIMKEVADIGSELEDKSKALGLDVSKDISEAIKSIDNSEKNLNKLYKIAKG